MPSSYVIAAATFYAPNKINNHEHLSLSVTTICVFSKCIASSFSFVLLLQAVQLVWNSVHFEVSKFSIPKAHLQLYYFVARSFIDLLQASSLWLFMMSRQLKSNRWRPASRSMPIVKNS